MEVQAVRGSGGGSKSITYGRWPTAATRGTRPTCRPCAGGATSPRAARRLGLDGLRARQRPRGPNSWPNSQTLNNRSRVSRWRSGITLDML